MNGTTDSHDALAPWRAAWPRALAAWSRYTRLREPLLCVSSSAAAQAGLDGSFAMIRLVDQLVVIDVEAVRAHGLAGFELEILAHEVGHHVLAPASVTDQLRLLARIRRALPTLERHAPMVANLYTDLLINDRLQRQAGLRMADVYAALARRAGKAGKVWQLYLGICEELWQRQGQLGADLDEALGTDAWLGARVVRVYANEWLVGAGRFATLLLPYLVEDAQLPAPVRGLMDTLSAGEGAEPAGALEVEADEVDGAVHPVHDPAITGLEEEPEHTPDRDPPPGGSGQTREPFEYGEMLRAAGLRLSDSQIAVRYYRQRAMPHLVPFPMRRVPQAPEPHLEALEPWHLGEPLDEIDWLHSVMLSPRPIPGMTTLRRTLGQEPAHLPRPLPVDLDLFVDSSGSMPDPRVSTSWTALAGAVIALSALRSGAAVRVTLWSGKHEVLQTQGFVRDEHDILAVLTGYFGGATAFPIHQLRDTYCGPGLQPRPRPRRTHLLMISDDGIDTMFEQDERRHSGWDVAASALAAGAAGGTMALNLWRRPAADREPLADHPVLQRAAREQGWQIGIVQQREDLLDFARAFSRQHYLQGGSSA